MKLKPLLYLSLFFIACSYAVVGQSLAPKRCVAIVSVNDMHAEMERFPRFAFMVDSLRKVYPDLLLFSAGDIQTGNPVNDQYVPKGHPMIALMNGLGFDLSAVGNHEFDVGPDRLAEITHEAEFPFISCNIFPPKGWQGSIAPYRILSLHNGLKVAVLGGIELDGGNGIPSTHPARVKDFSFTLARKLVPQYRFLRDSANLMVMLTHLGVPEDSIIAEQNPWIDLIVGGHSHTYIHNKMEVNGVAITQSQNKLKHCALTLVTFDEAGKPIDITIRSLDIEPSHGKENEIFRLAVQHFSDNPIFREKVAVAEDHFTNEVELGYLMCDAMRTIANADFAFHNHGGVRSPNLLKGPISILDVYTLDPFGNELMKIELTPKEIRNFLYYCWKREGNLPMLCSGTLRIEYRLAADGNPAEIRLYTPDGKPLDERKHYSVAYNSYIDASYPYVHRLNTVPVGLTSAEAIIRYLRDIKQVPSYRGMKRYSIVKK